MTTVQPAASGTEFVEVHLSPEELDRIECTASMRGANHEDVANLLNHLGSDLHELVDPEIAAFVQKVIPERVATAFFWPGVIEEFIRRKLIDRRLLVAQM